MALPQAQSTSQREETHLLRPVSSHIQSTRLWIEYWCFKIYSCNSRNRQQWSIYGNWRCDILCARKQHPDSHSSARNLSTCHNICNTIRRSPRSNQRWKRLHTKQGRRLERWNGSRNISRCWRDHCQKHQLHWYVINQWSGIAQRTENWILSVSIHLRYNGDHNQCWQRRDCE